MVLKKLFLRIGLLCLLASPGLAFENNHAPNDPELGVDLPLPTLPEPAKPKVKFFCGGDC